MIAMMSWQCPTDALRLAVSSMASMPLSAQKSGNPDLPLLRSDECRDVGNIVGRHCRNRRHVAKLPVVGSRTIFRGELERNVAMVRRLVDLVEEWRPLVATLQVRAMAGSAIGRIELLSKRRVRHQPHARLGNLHALRIHIQTSQ
jgi:hypothetical protein